MDVHQSDISKMLRFSTSNLVSFIFIKSRHFMEAYLVLLHKTSHTSCVLFFFWFPRAGSRENTTCFFEVRLFVALLLQRLKLPFFFKSRGLFGIAHLHINNLDTINYLLLQTGEIIKLNIHQIYLSIFWSFQGYLKSPNKHEAVFRMPHLI